ncbi:hypothetical protein NVP1266O_44 [Vibrio phage 1.266.O._10N.286.52.F9]|nr:hypothetical protein NVP1266O_44 [Vibrio phage 1.266.O._10N.286.52.F9]
MEMIRVKFTGINPLLINNPQQVDPFNKFAKASKLITGKRKKTDEDLLALRDIEIESKVYFDDHLKIWVPSTWIMALISGVSFKKAKIAKKDIRSAVFMTENKLKLSYAGDNKVKTITDIVKNEDFHVTLNLKQGQVRVCKAAPIFNDWSFETCIEFDDTIINESELKDLLVYGAKYGGLGDFRPTYGRANVEFLEV